MYARRWSTEHQIHINTHTHTSTLVDQLLKQLTKCSQIKNSYSFHFAFKRSNKRAVGYLRVPILQVDEPTVATQSFHDLAMKTANHRPCCVIVASHCGVQLIAMIARNAPLMWGDQYSKRRRSMIIFTKMVQADHSCNIVPGQFLPTKITLTEGRVTTLVYGCGFLRKIFYWSGANNWSGQDTHNILCTAQSRRLISRLDPEPGQRLRRVSHYSSDAEASRYVASYIASYVWK